MAKLNGPEVKPVKPPGRFLWNHHDDVGDVSGLARPYRVEFRDRIVELGPVEMVVVPRGIEHRTAADDEAEIILLEPACVLNTGNITDQKFTAPPVVKI